MNKLALVVFSLFCLTGCYSAGARASIFGSGGADGGAMGNCPAGETCAPETPYGLGFRGTQFDDDLLGTDGVAPVARLGRSSVSIIALSRNSGTWGGSVVGETMPLPDASVTTAESSNSFVFSAWGSIAGATVSGHREGTADLRIVQRSTGALYDKMQMRVASIASVELLLRHSRYARSTSRVLVPWALFRGTEVQVTVALRDARGERLADESLTVASEGGTTYERLRWDAGNVKDNGESTLRLRVTAGGRVHEPNVPVVDQVDSISFVGINAFLGLGREVLNLSVGSSEMFCFAPRRDGRLVVNAPVTFTGSSGVRVRANAGLGLDVYGYHSCALVTAEQEGPASITATVLGRSVEVRFNVTPRQEREEVATETPVGLPFSQLFTTGFEPGQRSFGIEE